MKQTFKRVYNQTALPQSIVWKGMQIVISPHEERDMATEVADAFLERCDGFVVLAPEVDTVFATGNSGTMWIANVTGNPDYPAKVEVKVWRDKRWQWAEEENALRHPTTLHEVGCGGMREYTAKDGVLEAENLPQFTVSLPAFKRVEVPKVVGEWFLNRSANGAFETRHGRLQKAIASRRPSRFEPDFTWSLDEMWAYLKLIDPDAAFGRSEKTIRAGTKKKTPQEIDQVIDNEKRLALKKLYFRLIDPRYKLPTKPEFEAYMRGPEGAELATLQEAPVSDLAKITAPDPELANLTE